MATNQIEQDCLFCGKMLQMPSGLFDMIEAHHIPETAGLACPFGRIPVIEHLDVLAKMSRRQRKKQQKE